eukprot:1251374-Pyramimonas_sp.AAC.1
MSVPLASDVMAGARSGVRHGAHTAARTERNVCIVRPCFQPQHPPTSHDPCPDPGPPYGPR